MYPELHTVNSISIVCNGGNNLSITRISKSSPSISIKSRDSNISRLDVNCAIYQTKLLPTISTNSNQLTHKADAIVNVSSQSKRSSIISTIPIESTFNEMSNVIADMIINYIIKEHDKSIGFCKIKSIFEQEIKLLCKAIRDLLHWLKKNQHESKYIWFHGLFCYYITNDSKESFKLFSEASKGNFAIAKVYLAKCYIDGYGTDRNNKKAFDLFKESVEIGSICGQFYLGYCYENGIGTKMDEKKSIEWYTNAANNANAPAIYYLAECYRSGKGVKVDEATAVKWYEALAKLEIVEAQLQLGNCNRYGIGVKINVEGALGVEINKTKAFWLNKIAAKKGNTGAQNNLGVLYENGEEKKEDEALKFYGIAAEKEHRMAQNNLGLLYENRQDLKSAAYWPIWNTSNIVLTRKCITKSLKDNDDGNNQEPFTMLIQKFLCEAVANNDVEDLAAVCDA
ncbi:17478_t:CDS:2 [Funneliformis geosporum]|uniref:17478_t:CDS:1 n=1 Tax=Funneliformis geosporum TaxID=1117311 RepID=A0A9W4SIA9_9GLOM|nr:17478_t:CDS:2 [Funneliformis geosporum]